MDRLHQLEVFVAVADAGGFAKAGNRLRISPPSVTRTIMALEARLGVRLFNRTTRSLSLTEIGARFLETSRSLLSEIDAAEKDVVGETTAPQGHLVVTASATFGRLALTPVVCAFQKAYPRVTASALLLDRIANLVEEGIDVAVRIGDLPDSSLMARRIGTVRRVLVASPDYLARRGRPEAPADLKLHSIIAFTGLMANREWRFLRDGVPGGVSLVPRLEINDALAAISAAEAGDGITVALSYMVADRIEERRLQLVLEEFATPAMPVHLVYPSSRVVAPKIRAFVDFAAPRLRSALEKLALDPQRSPRRQPRSKHRG
ncbi:MAG TPA: LysR family transcriptional regulator [Alphaproteobacteria bacterium]|nr:LysR family transcriptional regulator [Alphaproteobacteria bacterium]